jgi:hypothetical protein
MNARAKLRRAEEAMERSFAERDERQLEERAAERHLDELVRCHLKMSKTHMNLENTSSLIHSFVFGCVWLFV